MNRKMNKTRIRIRPKQPRPDDPLYTYTRRLLFISGHLQLALACLLYRIIAILENVSG